MSDLHLDIQGHTLLDLAAELMKTCVAMATSTATGLAAEATHFEERKPIPIVCPITFIYIYIYIYTVKPLYKKLIFFNNFFL